MFSVNSAALLPQTPPTRVIASSASNNQNQFYPKQPIMTPLLANNNRPVRIKKYK